MTDYTLDKYDFKKYLLNQLHDTRQEDLIFWKKNIPMPVDLIYEIFEKRGVLLNRYIHQIGAAYLFAWIARKEGHDWSVMLALQPTKRNDKAQTRDSFRQYAEASGVTGLLAQLSEMFLLENFKTDEGALAEALCHEGRKYERLYIPPVIREKINVLFPELLHHMALKNWDMFSNVVADELHIYRMGFADAFAGIFNKLIEYILRNSGSSKKGYSNVSGLKIYQEKEMTESKPVIVYGLVQDGCIWEPVYKDARTTFVLNKMHPFASQIKKAGQDAQEIISRLIAVMAEKENELIRPGDKRLIEIFRQDVSRELRIQAENDQATL
jgi:hypothetical protein